MVLLSIDWTNLHELLRSLYDEMMPLCEDMASVAKGVAGIGALFYVAYRVWQSLSRAEEIDVFPLFRPFVLGEDPMVLYKNFRGAEPSLEPLLKNRGMK